MYPNGFERFLILICFAIIMVITGIAKGLSIIVAVVKVVIILLMLIFAIAPLFNLKGKSKVDKIFLGLAHLLTTTIYCAYNLLMFYLLEYDVRFSRGIIEYIFYNISFILSALFLGTVWILLTGGYLWAIAQYSSFGEDIFT